MKKNEIKKEVEILYRIACQLKEVRISEDKTTDLYYDGMILALEDVLRLFLLK